MKTWEDDKIGRLIFERYNIREIQKALEESKKITNTETGVNEQQRNDVWQRGTKFLSKIEHFCVGVQVGAFDISTLNRMAGGYFIKQYEKWEPIIKKKRQDDNSMKHYDEFEDIVKKRKKACK